MESKEEASIKLKEFHCLIALDDPTTALRELETVPQALRDTKINTALGKHYFRNGLKRHAISAFRDVVRSEPKAIEAIITLISLGVDQVELNELIKSSCDSLPWLPIYVRAMYSKKQSKNDGPD